MLDRYKGAILLAAAADALGWITEFESDTKFLVSKYGTDRITEFVDWDKKTGGKFLGYTDYISRGSYSDDTQLMLCVCRSINSDGSVDNEYFSKVELKDWLLYVRGGGKTIKTAARNLEKKAPRWNSNFFKTSEDALAYHNAGANGAAMRMLPIVLANQSDRDTMILEVFKNSIVTHGHPRAIIGSMLYSLSAVYFLKADVLPDYPNEIISVIAKELKSVAALINHLEDMGLSAWVDRWDSTMNVGFCQVFQTTVEDTLELLRYTYKSIAANTSNTEVFKSLGALDKDTRGAGHISAVAALFMATKYIYEAPIQAIYECANMLGSDTDTIGLMCGSMIGSYIGFEQIPKSLRRVQDSQYLLDCAEALLSRSIDTIKSHDRECCFNNENRSTKLFDLTTLSVDDEIHLSSLGVGIVSSVSEQDTITTGKSVLIVEVDFEIGQSCKFSKIISKESGKADGKSIE
jgi:ADP-ribosylglycohydrolase